MTMTSEVTKRLILRGAAILAYAFSAWLQRGAWKTNPDPM